MQSSSVYQQLQPVSDLFLDSTSLHRFAVILLANDLWLLTKHWFAIAASSSEALSRGDQETWIYDSTTNFYESSIQSFSARLSSQSSQSQKDGTTTASTIPAYLLDR